MSEPRLWKIDSETRLTLASDLSRTLNLSNEEGEKWIVNLIRDSRMGVDAKIDLASVSPHPLSLMPGHRG